jgi:hypothetical protein
MERYKNLVNSECLSCGEWLCVTAGSYTGEVNCLKCGFINVFLDSLKPIEELSLSRSSKHPIMGSFVSSE